MFIKIYHYASFKKNDVTVCLIVTPETPSKITDRLVGSVSHFHSS